MFLGSNQEGWHSSMHNQTDNSDANFEEAVRKRIAKSLGEISRSLTYFSIDMEGKVTPSAEFQMDLRAFETRADLLHQLVNSVCPSQAYTGIWDGWLSGKGKPFDGPKLPKVGSAKENPAQTLHRASDRVAKARRKVDELEADDPIEAKRLMHAEAIEKAALCWIITDHLLNIVKPIFAMGPAWTVMRAISSVRTRSEHLMKSGPTASSRWKWLETEETEDRKKETRKMLHALDFWAGDPVFEIALRYAILDVVNRFEPLEEEARRDGRHPRPEERQKYSINPESATDAEAVLRGHKIGKHPPHRYDAVY